MSQQSLVRLGRTNLVVPKLGFGALPIQRTPEDEAVRILHRAYEGGIRFFDTARMYSNSEAKLGLALSPVRREIVIATKTTAKTASEAEQHLDTSLAGLRTGYVDIAQLHNADAVPDPKARDTAYAALVKAREEGRVRFIGVSCHRRDVAQAAIRSGLFDTLQFPLSHISTPEDLSLIEDCRKHDVGLIAMKALSGGLLTNIPAAVAFLNQFDNVVPIWGIQHMHELEQFLALQAQPPLLDAALQSVIERDRRELAGSFCRGCAYCLPCPAEIPIHWAARMSFLLRRAPYQQFLTPEWRQQMDRIDACTECGTCASRCPYHLDTPALLKTMLSDYRQFAASH
jgi:predicted aldo/keto reductase-like oxidoreductase